MWLSASLSQFSAAFSLSTHILTHALVILFSHQASDSLCILAFHMHTQFNEIHVYTQREWYQKNNNKEWKKKNSIYSISFTFSGSVCMRFTCLLITFLLCCSCSIHDGTIHRTPHTEATTTFHFIIYLNVLPLRHTHSRTIFIYHFLWTKRVVCARSQ